MQCIVWSDCRYSEHCQTTQQFTIQLHPAVKKALLCEKRIGVMLTLRLFHFPNESRESKNKFISRLPKNSCYIFSTIYNTWSSRVNIFGRPQCPAEPVHIALSFYVCSSSVTTTCARCEISNSLRLARYQVVDLSFDTAACLGNLKQCRTEKGVVF